MRYLNFANQVKSNSQQERLLTMIDFSGSMFEEDIQPNRLEAAIKANQEIIRVKRQHHPNDKIGVISFQSTAKLSLQRVRPSDIGDLYHEVDDGGLEGGTDFVAPLKVAYNCFFDKPIVLYREQG